MAQEADANPDEEMEKLLAQYTMDPGTKETQDKQPKVKATQAFSDLDIVGVRRLADTIEDPDGKEVGMGPPSKIERIMKTYGFSKIEGHVYGSESMAIAVADGQALVMLGYNLKPNAEAQKIAGDKDRVKNLVVDMIKRVVAYVNNDDKTIIRTPFQPEKIWPSFSYNTAYPTDIDLEDALGNLIFEANEVNRHVKNEVMPTYFEPPERPLGSVRLFLRKATPIGRSTIYNSVYANLSGANVYKMHKPKKSSKAKK